MLPSRPFTRKTGYDHQIALLYATSTAIHFPPKNVFDAKILPMSILYIYTLAKIDRLLAILCHFAALCLPFACRLLQRSL